MRRTIQVAAWGLMLTVAHAAWSQQQLGTNTRFLGGMPQQLNFTPIDVSKATAPGNINKAFRTPSSQANSPFNLSNIFPKISLGSWPPVSPQVSVLPQKQNIFQPNPPKGGVNLFSGSTTGKTGKGVN